MNITLDWDTVTHVAVLGGALLTLSLLWRIFSRVEKVVSIIPTVEAMAAQYKKNGGSTYRDKVDKVVETQEGHTAILNQLKGAMNANPGPNEHPSSQGTPSAT